ncbi:MAG: acyltransferase [Ruminococcaceae bacterium]|jgi:peptidoglycan/LPS O-acetylase OafA/YrhL|nr:acyltransferase [Oscillospiraceae bacterium]
MSKRNGKIELLRFVFAITVLLFHVQIDCDVLKEPLFGVFYVFPFGKLGVEFFFLLSGMLMANSIDRDYRKADNHPDLKHLGTDTVSFIWRKIKTVLPYHIIFCVLAIGIGIYKHGKSNESVIEYLIIQLPSVFFMNSTGWIDPSSTGLIAPEWYLSAMFLVMLVIYPLVKRYWNVVPYTFCPFAGILCIGYLLQTFNGLPGNIGSFTGVVLSVNIRAFGVLCLGVTCFKASERIKETELKALTGAFLKLLELVCYMAVPVLMCIKKQYVNTCVIMLLMVALTITFSGKGIGNQSPLFQNAFCRYLGRLSLPIYLG